MLKAKDFYPSENESYEDYMIRMEGFYNKTKECASMEKVLEAQINKVKAMGYNIIILGNKVKITPNYVGC